MYGPAGAGLMPYSRESFSSSVMDETVARARSTAAETAAGTVGGSAGCFTTWSGRILDAKFTDPRLEELVSGSASNAYAGRRGAR